MHRASLAACLTACLVATGPAHAAEPLVKLLQTPPPAATAAAAAHPAEPLLLWSETVREPQPLAVYFLRADLRHPACRPVAVVSDDPDGRGPAEAALVSPGTLFKRHGLIAAVNANAFSRAPNAGKIPGWHHGLHVDIRGLAISNTITRSGLDHPGATSSSALAVLNDGSITIGRPDDLTIIRHAVGDWGAPLLTNGTILPAADSVRHPRTAVGIDKTGRILLFAVVDGRRPGHSAGTTLRELATLMKHHGCHHAINLDGGGSSVLLYRETPDGPVKTYNRPSGNTHRPVPVLFGIRAAR
ncbi:MAG: phosphodiester glycosidase family protein [Verrucomicrobiales bacterium]|nr:phosphodiester glycosidase family protein [Verrucomicrobiota bacterium JB025]